MYLTQLTTRRISSPVASLGFGANANVPRGPKSLQCNMSRPVQEQYIAIVQEYLGDLFKLEQRLCSRGGLLMFSKRIRNIQQDQYRTLQGKDKEPQTHTHRSISTETIIFPNVLL